MLKVELTKNKDRIIALLLHDNLNMSMGQYHHLGFSITPEYLERCLFFIATEDDTDIGLFIAEPLSYQKQYNVHVGFKKKYRGFKAFACGKLFVSLMEQYLDHGTLLAMPPATKPQAVIMGTKLGFVIRGILPNALEISDENNNKKLVDQIIMARSW